MLGQNVNKSKDETRTANKAPAKATVASISTSSIVPNPASKTQRLSQSCPI